MGGLPGFTGCGHRGRDRQEAISKLLCGWYRAEGNGVGRTAAEWPLSHVVVRRADLPLPANFRHVGTAPM